MFLLPLAAAHGQALPTASRVGISTGFELPRLAGSLTYGASVSESISSGFYSTQGTYAGTNLNGDLGYISPAKRDTFSLVVAGGRSWNDSGGSSPTYVSLGMSQLYVMKHLSFVFTDGLSYLPQTASTGLSGIPGAGDLGVTPISSSDQDQGILSVNSTRLGNSAGASVSAPFTGKTSIVTSVVYAFTIFFGGTGGNAGINGISRSISTGISHTINGRSSLSVGYSYSTSSYGDYQTGFTSQSVNLNYSRQISARLSVNASAGPQWTSSPAYSQNETPVNFFTSESASYTAPYANFSLTYSHGVNSGSGVLPGATSDSVRLTASRTFARVWNAAATAGYTRSRSLPYLGAPSVTPQTEVLAFQASRALGHNLSTYASYTLENQSDTGSALATGAFNGTSKIFAFGLSYSPAAIHFGSR